MHLFDFTAFLKDPLAVVVITKINVTEGFPSTRWGHSASTNDGKLYILGGRNDQDVCDLH